MDSAKDHRLDIYVDSSTYLALRARAKEEERTMSQHVRFLILRDLEQFCAAEIERENGQGARPAGAERA
jgi:hypothetical protein